MSLVGCSRIRVRRFFGLRCWTYIPPYPTPSYPWMFRVEDHIFCGIRNKCATRLSALKRAWWRAKWIQDGTFADRYGTFADRYRGLPPFEEEMRRLAEESKP